MYDLGIEAFLAVSDTQSISKASKILHITQSAVSHRIRDLEKQLGVTLIDRQKGIRHSKLTLAGEKFYPLADRWRQLWHETKQVQSTITSLFVRIGCVDSVSTLILPPFYQLLMDNDPSIYLKVFTMPSLELYEKIEKRELDVAFVLQKKRYRQINLVPFYQEPMMVVRSRERFAAGHEVRSENLDPTDELYINWSPTYQIWHDQTWEPLQHPKIELDSVFLIEALMQNSNHWAIVPESVAKKLSKKQKLLVQQLIPPAPDRTIYMINHRFPRTGVLKGIEIIQNIGRRLHFFHLQADFT